MAETTPHSAPDITVGLREVTRETLRSVLALRVKPGQVNLVADNATSIAEAHFAPTATPATSTAGSASRIPARYTKAST